MARTTHFLHACTVCNRRFKQSTRLGNHMQTEHPAQWHALKRRHATESNQPTDTAHQPTLPRCPAQLPSPILQQRHPFFQNDDSITIPPTIYDEVEMDIVEDPPSH